MLQPLLANLAVASMVLIAWITVAERVGRLDSTLRRLLLGASLAIGTLASMAMAFEVRPGVFFDLRNPLIVISGLFGGLPAALITATCAIAFRGVMGGAVLLGVVGIVLSMTVGLAIRRLAAGRPSVKWLAAAAATTALVGVALPLFIPGADWRIGLGDRASHIFMSFVATMLFGAVLLWEEQRRRLAEVNAQFRAMVYALPDCLNLKDLAGRFIAANPATARLMKVGDPYQLIGKTDADFYPPDLARRYREDEEAVLASGVAEVIEQKGRRADGTDSWLATLKAPAFDSDGTMVGLVTSNRDITERKALQDKLAETQAYLDQALRNMNDGLAIYNGSGNLLFCNERYRNMFPATAALRVPGADFRSIVSASIAAGEEVLPEGVTLSAHAEARLKDLLREGEYLINRPDGSIYASRTKVLDNGDALRIIADVTERFNHERTLEHQALHDPLTGLPNRAYFNKEIGRLLERAGRENEELVVMLLDLDRFKQVNDNFGHAAGDALLVEVARRLAGVVRSGDFVARLGGDEFAILLTAPPAGDVGGGMAARILKSLGRPMAFGDVTLLPGATLGYTVWPRDPSDADGLLSNADKALYKAKSRGRGTWKAYDVEAFRAGKQARV